jgi:putative PIN family toxin of toxin-antitoxin system
VRLVLDSNVLVAAFATHGACAELLERVFAAHELAIDDNLIDEVRRILVDKIRVPSDVAVQAIDLLRRHALLVETAPLTEPACRDPDDDRVLALCLAFGADALVTGDKDLLVLDPWDGMRIVTPGGFWALEQAWIERPR